MIGHFPDVMEKDQYLKPENFKYFETADFKSDHYVEFTNGRKLPISVIDTVYDLGDDYVTFEAVTLRSQSITTMDLPFSISIILEPLHNTESISSVYS